MAWPIPLIPEQSLLSPPRYGIWLVVLIVLVMIGTLSAMFIGNITTYGQLLLYGTLPGLLVWGCLFGTVLNRYEQSLAAVHAWYEETKQTKAQWRRWSRSQLAVVGNVLLTPEAAGMGAFLGRLEDIPLYPQKARSLFCASLSLSVRLHEIDGELERQFPGYRHHLHTVYVLHDTSLVQHSIRTAVFNQWDMQADYVSSIEQVPVLQQESEFTGVVLLLCLQHWADSMPKKFSELISAQLITSPTFAREQVVSVMSGLGRFMPVTPEKLSGDLNMLFDYNQLEKEQIQHVWLSGNTDIVEDLARYAETYHWILPKRQPVHLIDLTFGPPGELSFGISLAMMVEAVCKTSENQLIIGQTSQSSVWLCLVTKELFS